MLVNEPSGASQANLPLEHGSSRKLYRYWEAARAENAAPARSALDLRPIAALVPNLAIIEDPHRGGEFVWRLAGSGVCELLAREATGTRVALGFDAFEADVVQRLLAAVIEQLQPCVLKLKFVSEIGDKIPAELIGLPLLGHDGRSLQVLAGLFAMDEYAGRRSRKFVAIQLVAARSIWIAHLPGDSIVRRAGEHAPRLHLQLIPGGLG